MEFLPEGFLALATFKQFIVYVLTPSKNRPGKLDKLPINPANRHLTNAHDKTAWMDFDTANAKAKELGQGYGVGFVFTDNDPFWLLDIDDCLLPDKSGWSPLAIGLCSYFAGCAVEVSVSGTGVHIIGEGKPPKNHPCKNADLKIEFYSSGRFVALTGTGLMGSAGHNAELKFPHFFSEYFHDKVSTEAFSWTDEPCAEWNGSIDDDDLIRRALQSKSSRSAFGGAASFRDLWEANTEALAKAYPDAERDLGYDESSADAALAQHLAFWTGNDCERIRGLMMRSALNRDKWEREDYLVRTISGACARQKEWLSDKQTQPSTAASDSQQESPKASKTEGSTYVTPEQQVDFFEGHVYVADEHKILTNRGLMLKPDQFKSWYGGYTWVMDEHNQRETRNAWEAFTESQALRHARVDTTFFKPTLKPGQIHTRNGSLAVNIYYPINTDTRPGDVTPFLKHLAKLFPDERDRTLVLCYLAACVQYPGVKFQWCPIIQGVEGNGKSLLTRCVAYAIGDQYVHYPKASEIGGRFNDWLYKRLFIAVEDIYNGCMETIEIMKPMLTSERQEIEGKGQAKVTRDICANFLINTNHKDGLRKTKSDRRFAPFFTAQQHVEDLIRDGMGGDYFYDLYNWLDNGGYAIVGHFLKTFQIPDEYNPATHLKRAPETSSTKEAIQYGYGVLEQEILERVKLGRVGYRGGWISSLTLSKLLEDIGRARQISYSRRGEILENIGYKLHPGLKEGRAIRPVMPDVGRPKLYITYGHETENLLDPEMIMQAYERAQEGAA